MVDDLDVAEVQAWAAGSGRGTGSRPGRCAVWLGTTGGTDGIAQPGLPALSDLYAEFIDNGGQVWLCGACAKPRGITEEHLVKGSTIVGAAQVVEEVVAGAKTVAFA